MNQAATVRKAKQVLIERYPEEVAVVRSESSTKSERKDALAAIAHDNRDLIVNLVMLDERKKDERDYLKGLTSFALYGAILTVGLFIATVVAASAGSSQYLVGVATTAVAFVTLVVLVIRYDRTVVGYLEEIVCEGCA